MIMTIWAVKGGEQTGFGVKDDCPVSVCGIQLCEVLKSEQTHELPHLLWVCSDGPLQMALLRS